MAKLGAITQLLSRERAPDAVVVLVREPGGAHHGVDPVLGRPREVGATGVEGGEVDHHLDVHARQGGRVGVDLHVGVDARGVPEVQPRVVGIDGPHELEVRIGGDGPAHGAAHAATRPEHADPNGHGEPRPGGVGVGVGSAAPEGARSCGRTLVAWWLAPTRSAVRSRRKSTPGNAGSARYRVRRCSEHASTRVPSPVTLLECRVLPPRQPHRPAPVHRRRPSSAPRRRRPRRGARRPAGAGGTQRVGQVHPPADARRPPATGGRPGPPGAEIRHRRLPASGGAATARRDGARAAGATHRRGRRGHPPRRRHGRARPGRARGG